FFKDLEPRGRLAPMGTAEEIMGKIEKASEMADPTDAEIGIAKVQHLSWKAILDFYTCTECGRCSDNCPAHKTGKILSPKHLTLNLRDYLYGRENEFLNRPGGPEGATEDHAHAHANGDAHAHAHEDEHEDEHGDDHGH